MNENLLTAHEARLQTYQGKRRGMGSSMMMCPCELNIISEVVCDKSL